MNTIIAIQTVIQITGPLISGSISLRIELTVSSPYEAEVDPEIGQNLHQLIYGIEQYRSTNRPNVSPDTNFDSYTFFVLAKQSCIAWYQLRKR